MAYRAKKHGKNRVKKRTHAYSIMQADPSYCYLCAQLYNDDSPQKTEEHHVFFGTRQRDKSEAEGLKVRLCIPHHRTGPEAVHKNADVCRRLQIEAQKSWELAHNHEEWMQLTRRGHPCRRGQQYSGAHGDADVVGLTGIHLEVKRAERLNIDKAMERSRDDSYAESIKEGRYLIPVVMHRRNRCKWLVTMDLNDFIEVYEAWMQSEETHGGMALQGKK